LAVNDEPGVDGLLGRDFLDQFKVVIENHSLKLSPLAAPPSHNAVG
jgi:hypothetical protein